MVWFFLVFCVAGFFFFPKILKYVILAPFLGLILGTLAWCTVGLALMAASSGEDMLSLMTLPWFLVGATMVSFLLVHKVL